MARKLFIAVLCGMVGLLVAASGCKKKSDTEKALESGTEAVEKAAKNAQETAEKATKDATEAAEEATK